MHFGAWLLFHSTILSASYHQLSPFLMSELLAQETFRISPSTVTNRLKVITKTEQHYECSSIFEEFPDLVFCKYLVPGSYMTNLESFTD